MPNARFNDEDDDKEWNKKRKIMKRDQHDPFCSGIVASSRAIKILYPLAIPKSQNWFYTRSILIHKGRTGMRGGRE